MRFCTALVLFSVAIAGCEPKQQSEPPTAFSVADDAGRTITLPAPAERVVSLVPTVTDFIIAMGLSDRLIARTDYDTATAIRQLPSIGGGLTPSIEWIAAQRPHLVIAWPDNPSRSLVARLNSIDVPTYAARTESIEDALRTIRNMGTLLDAQAKADSLADALSNALDSIKAGVAALPRVRVAYVIGTDPPMIAGPGTFIDQLLTVAGGDNIFADVKQLWPQINLEELVQRDPDVIVLSYLSDEDPVAMLRRLPGWRELRAVQAGRVYRVSPYFFDRSGPLMPQAASELVKFFGNVR